MSQPGFPALRQAILPSGNEVLTRSFLLGAASFRALQADEETFGSKMLTHTCRDFLAVFYRSDYASGIRHHLRPWQTRVRPPNLDRGRTPCTLMTTVITACTTEKTLGKIFDCRCQARMKDVDITTSTARTQDLRLCPRQGRYDHE